MNFDLSSIWPDWEIAEPINKGAFGAVYKAVRKKNDDVAAVKIISIPQNMEEIEFKRYQCSDDTIRASYEDQAKEVLAEIKIMKELAGSGNIVGIQDYELVEKPGGIGCDIYIRMELLQPMEKHHIDLELADNCADYILPQEEIVKIGSDICRALETCHGVTTETKNQIIHRDIKPANILYHQNSDSYKLGDFGVSKEMNGADVNLTRSIGTANYMAPEVIGRKYDSRADIYSLGLVLYYLANNKRLPFVRESGRHKDEVEAYDRRMAGECLPPPENASPKLAEVLLKACSYSPEDRYASAKEFRHALEACREDPVSRQTDSVEPQAPKAALKMSEVGEFGPGRRKVAGSIVLLVLSAVLVAGLLIGKFSPALMMWLSPAEETGGSTQTSDTLAITASAIDTQKNPDKDSRDGKSKETAILIDLSDSYDVKIEDEGDWERWYQLKTSPNISNYFLYLCGSDSTFSSKVQVLNEDLEIITDGYSCDQMLELGTHLDSDTQYWIRIYGNKLVTAYQFRVEEKLCDAGISRENALPIQLNTDYQKTISVDGEVDWYAFATSEKESIYRVFVNAKAGKASVNGKTIFALYDAQGIKLKQETIEYEKSGYFDIYLSSKTSYTVKIYAENTVSATGDYLLRITENPIDAGLDKDTAKPLEIGTQYKGKLDNSLSDWFVFIFESDGRYVLDLHNVDTGCRVSVSASEGASFSLTAKNEDSASREFTVGAGEKLYLEVKPWGANDAEAVNGTYIINITKTGAQ